MQNLQSFHTFHIHANAREIIEAHSIEQLQQAWAHSKAENLPALFLGQGSNMLFLDDFNGVVILNRLMGITHQQDSDFHYLHVNGGENWHELVEWSINNGIYGLENLALIPGCAGSAPIQNIGAYGVEFKDVCDYVDVLNLNTNETFRLDTKQCEFGYRESIFKHRYQQGYVITAVGLKLTKNWQPILKYGSLVEFDPKTVTAKQIFDEVCHIRQSKLPNPNEFGNGSVKLAAGWLIDQCNLKGFQIGDAAVHEKQALVLINKSGATGQDVVKLAHHVRQTVAEKFGVYLQPEVRFIGATGEVNSEQTIA